MPYTRSKTIAERAATGRALHKLPRPLEWVAINPGLVLGPVLDKDSSVQLVAKLLKGEIPGLPRFGYPIVDVRDLADLEVRAMTVPQALTTLHRVRPVHPIERDRKCSEGAFGRQGEEGAYPQTARLGRPVGGALR